MKHNEWSEYTSGVEDEVTEMGEGNKRHLLVVVGSVLWVNPLAGIMRNNRVRTYSCIFSDYFSRGDCLFLEKSSQGEHVLGNFFLRRLVSLHQRVEVVPPVSHIFVVVAPVSLTDVSSTGRLHK